MDYKKKYFYLLKQKEKTFMYRDNDWAVEGDDSDEDMEYVNLALVANSDQEASSANNQVISTNLSELSKDECNSTIYEISIFIIHTTRN